MYGSNLNEIYNENYNKQGRIIKVIVYIFLVLFICFGAFQIIKSLLLDKGSENASEIEELVVESAKKYMSNNNLIIGEGESKYFSFSEINYDYEQTGCTKDGGIVVNNLAGSISYTPYYQCGNKKSIAVEELDKQNNYCKSFLELKGSNPMYLEKGEKYIEPGFRTSTSESKITIESDLEDEEGDYYISYIGNYDGRDCIATRMVIVEDSLQYQSKGITLFLNLHGDETMTIEKGKSYSEPGYEATDTEEGNLTKNVKIVGSVNTNVIGSYALTYSITNSKGQTVRKYRTIIVSNKVEQISKNIKLTGSSIIKISKGETFDEPGYTAYDDEFGDITDEVQIISNLDTNTVGNYTITYSVINSKGENDIAVRTIIVTEAPLVPSNVTVEKNSNFTNEPVVITLNISGDYSYTLLPNGNNSVNNPIYYKVSTNGRYNFVVYNTAGVAKTTTVVVSNIDVTAPKGSCTLKNGLITVSASDPSGIKGYNYNIEGISTGYTTNKTYTVSSSLTSASVTIKDNAGNENTFNCNYVSASTGTPTGPKEEPVSSNPYSPKDGDFGKMYIKDGYFYVPKFKSGNTSTYSGKAGTEGTGTEKLNTEFDNMLKSFFLAAEEEGHNIYVDKAGGWRSYETQVSCAKKNPYCVRNPGNSIHGWAIAADLNYGNSKATAWAHSNADRFGLKYTVCTKYPGNCREPWHIEPKNLKKY